MSQSGYFKKITPQSLRMSSEQKCKEGDFISQTVEATNKTELLFFADNATVFKSRGSDFADTKASTLGDFIPAKLGFDEGSNVVKMITTTDYSGYLIFVFENGKCAKVPLSAYATKTNRKKLANAYGTKAGLVDIFFVEENGRLMLRSSNGRMIIFDTALINPKAARDTQGVQCMTLKAKSKLDKAFMIDDAKAEELSKYVVKNIPVAGSFAKDVEDPDQIHF
jgi:DNA gyrase subunit A